MVKYDPFKETQKWTENVPEEAQMLDLPDKDF